MSATTDLPPAYQESDTAKRRFEVTVFHGLSPQEKRWLRHFSERGDPLRFCPTCRDYVRPCSALRHWLDKVMLIGPFHLSRAPRPFDLIRLDEVVCLRWRRLLAAMCLGRYDPRRASAELKRAIVVRDDRNIFSHHVDSKIINGRPLLKIQSYRGLQRMSLADVRACLPARIHCQGSPLLCEQFKEALKEMRYGHRRAGIVFRCEACPTEYVTVVVPRAPCNLPGSRLSKSTAPHLRDVPNQVGVAFDRYMVVTYCRWIDLGPCDSTSGVIEERLDPRGSRTACGGQPLDSFSDHTEPICILFDGPIIWPYTTVRPKIIPVSNHSSNLTELIQDVNPKIVKL